MTKVTARAFDNAGWRLWSDPSPSTAANTARMFTCDLTKRYVKINGDYRS